MNVVVTGSSFGMGYSICQKFLTKGHQVFGLDCVNPIASTPQNFHFSMCDVSDKSSLPEIENVDILINNAGIQTTSNQYTGNDISVNLVGVMNCTEKYGLQPNIKSILNQASVSAHTGAEFPEYCVSKGGVLTYTKWTANEIAKYGATCNSISCGGVKTLLNQPVMNDTECWSQIMQLTPLKKWAEPEEIAEWVYFLTVLNKSCTGQDIIIDNGETVQTHFIWR